MDNLICRHVDEALPAPSGFAPAPVSPAAPGAPAKPLSFEEQQEALYAILTSYEDDEVD